MVYDNILNSILRTKSRLPTVENASYVKVEVFDRFQEELKIHFYHGPESTSTYHISLKNRLIASIYFYVTFAQTFILTTNRTDTSNIFYTYNFTSRFFNVIWAAIGILIISHIRHI